MRIKNFTPNEQRELIKMLNDGYSALKVAVKLGKNRCTVNRIAKKLGFEYVNNKWQRTGMKDDTISKELFATVMEIDIEEEDFITGELKGRNFCFETAYGADNINVCDLAEICKELVFQHGYFVTVAPYVTRVTDIKSGKQEVFQMTSEEMSKGKGFSIRQVIKACEWAFKNIKD